MTGQNTVTVQLRWHGGAPEELPVPLPPQVSEPGRPSAELGHRVRARAQECSDEPRGQQLTQDGRKTTTGTAFTVSGMRGIRHKPALPAATRKRAEERTGQAVAEKFRVRRHVG